MIFMVRKPLDASPLANKGKHDGSDTATMRVVSGPDSTTGGSPDSDETWKSQAFFKPGKPPKGQDGNKMHQPAKSVPTVATEPFPKLADSFPFPYGTVAEGGSFNDEELAGVFREQTSLAAYNTRRPQTTEPYQQTNAANEVQGFPPTAYAANVVTASSYTESFRPWL